MPAVCAASAGTRLSRISVVLPEPDTPVTTVSRPLGMSTFSGLTVWMASVERWMRPSANSSAAGRFRGAALPCPPRNGPIWDAGFPARSATVPSAMTSCMTPFRPTMLEGCNPMDGSSSTYKTPVVRLRTARASCIRWRSPVESVDDARSSVR